MTVAQSYNARAFLLDVPFRCCIELKPHYVRWCYFTLHYIKWHSRALGQSHSCYQHETALRASSLTFQLIFLLCYLQHFFHLSSPYSLSCIATHVLTFPQTRPRQTTLLHHCNTVTAHGITILYYINMTLRYMLLVDITSQHITLYYITLHYIFT